MCSAVYQSSYKGGFDVFLEHDRVRGAIQAAVAFVLAVGGVRGAVGGQEGAALHAGVTVGTVVVTVV